MTTQLMVFRDSLAGYFLELNMWERVRKPGRGFGRWCWGVRVSRVSLFIFLQ